MSLCLKKGQVMATEQLGEIVIAPRVLEKIIAIAKIGRAHV